MNEEMMLQHHEALLVQELALVRAKLAYIRLIKADSTKGNITPCLIRTSNIVGTPCTEPKKAISMPFPSGLKIEASPVQTEIGKDISKPLMVGALPKSIIEDSTSKNLATEEIKNLINLRPNQGIQIPKDGVKSADEQSSSSGIPIPNKNSKPYYVVFNGPNRGIFESWEIAKKATEGISHIKHQKYKTFLEAKVAANIYCREQLLEENSMQLICNADSLRPANFAAALSKRKKL